MQLFPASVPPELAAMDIVEPFPETVLGSQYILVIRHCYYMLARAVRTSKMTATHVTNLFMDHELIPYSIPTYLLADNGTKFVGKFLATVCLLLEDENFTATAYHA